PETYESTYFASLSDQELEDTFGGVGYLVTEGERQVYEALPPDAKRRYLTQFFMNQDTDFSPRANSFLDEYLDRIGRVRMQYGELVGTGERPPWLTEAGRIYMRYGEPDERLVNHMPSGSDTRSVGGISGLQGEPPYEIWSYHSTGYLYLFVQENQFDVWRMIFTSDPNLQSLADWRGRIGGEASRDLSTKFGIQPRF
ncbi:MAG: GWxTD domain-containing protein, partial [Gemmatimonadota bacterium]|nr:GWxTD domain-containing protein [Gemmatimonadota bacterium]